MSFCSEMNILESCTFCVPCTYRVGPASRETGFHLNDWYPVQNDGTMYHIGGLRRVGGSWSREPHGPLTGARTVGTAGFALIVVYNLQTSNCPLGI